MNLRTFARRLDGTVIRSAAGLLISSIMLAQSAADTNTLTVQASRTVRLTPEQATFSVRISTGTETSVAQVLSSVRSIGLDANAFQDVTTGFRSVLTLSRTPQQVPSLDYTFQLSVPFGKLNETIGAIDALQKTLATDRKWDTSYSLTGLQASTSTAEESRQRALPELFADARRKAEGLAKSAGVGVGSIRNISETTSFPVLDFGLNGSAASATFSVTVTYTLISYGQ